METGFLYGNGIEALPQFLTSLAIGLLIGLERERNPSTKAGLLTVAGTIISAYLNYPHEHGSIMNIEQHRDCSLSPTSPQRGRGRRCRYATFALAKTIRAPLL